MILKVSSLLVTQNFIAFCKLLLCVDVAGNLDLVGQKQVFKAENNPWLTPIQDQFQLGISHVFDYIRTDTFK